MANQRLINCDFFIKGAFDDVSSNKAKLLYFYFFINADDFGFVGNASKIIKVLNEDMDQENALVNYKFENACDELIDKGFLYRFVDNHGNQVLLIRHFFMHNKYNPKYITTNYISLRAKVELVDGCWEMKKKPLKENKQNNENNANNEKEEEKVVDDKDWEKHWDETMKELSEKNPPKEPSEMTFDEILDAAEGEEDD